VTTGDYWAVQQAKEALVEATWAETDALETLRGFEIPDDEEQEFAAKLLREVKEQWKTIEAQRKKITTPLNEALKQTNALFKPVLTALEEGESLLKSKITAYLEQKARANTAALQAASVAPTPAAATAALSTVAPVAPPTGVSVRHVWKFEVTDPDLVPREYCSPDGKKIGAVDPTTTQIPGVRFFQEPVVSSRRV
jgi:hypothetical protein